MAQGHDLVRFGVGDSDEFIFYPIPAGSMTSTIKLNDGTEIPSLAFGTGTALYGRDAEKAIKLAIDNGFTHLDGAQVYGNEASLGAGIKASGRPRSELYVVTKLKSGLGHDKVRESLIESLEKLGLENVDLFLIHSPAGFTDEELKQLWQAMEAVHVEGLAKSIGVSNFRVQHLKAILPGAKIIPSVNQIELHPYVWKAAEPIVKYGLEKGNITPASYSGLTPLVRVVGGPVDEVLPPITERLGKVLGKPVSQGQVLSKWVLQKGAIVVTTSTKQARIKEYLETSQVPDLTAEEVEAIDTAGAKLYKREFMRHVFEE
ncbi:NADP-dependent oxidoreductase domain-containing protein [Mycena sp. CBHHK59/15]|nr:NADP-dependent oxidoreductase domain-containing protein [Mycena sp. CBHHK59/15]